MERFINDLTEKLYGEPNIAQLVTKARREFDAGNCDAIRFEVMGSEVEIVERLMIEHPDIPFYCTYPRGTR